MSDDYVSSEHLLLAIVAERDGTAGTIVEIPIDLPSLRRE